MSRRIVVICLTFFFTQSIGCSQPGDSSGISNDSNARRGKTKLQGSGASFPAPLYLRWFKQYQKISPNTYVDYQAKGSGAGIQDLVNETVDFAASDSAMTPDEVASVKRGVLMLPLTAGKIVLSYNLPGGPSDLKLSREAYTKIFMGEITRWNDPVISACNPNTTLPNTFITVVVRSDSSGTTYVFSKHLSAISEAWNTKYSVNKSINWPSVSHLVKAPKNDGVLALVKQTAGAVGYVEYSFAVQTKQPMASLENKSGSYVRPTAESGAAALQSVQEIPEDLVLWIPDPDGAQSYPIVTYTWLLCYRQYSDAGKTQALKSLIEYCIDEGQEVSESIGYMKLPESMVEQVRKAIQEIR